MTSEAKFPDVLAAVRDAALREDGPVRADYALFRKVEEALGLEIPAGGLFARHDRDKLDGQIGRALGKLTAEGVLVKGGQGRGKVCYWAPAAWKAHQEQEAERKAAEAALEERKSELMRRTRLLVGEPTFYVAHRSQVTMDLDTLAALLDLAEKRPS